MIYKLYLFVCLVSFYAFLLRAEDDFGEPVREYIDGEDATADEEHLKKELDELTKRSKPACNNPSCALPCEQAGPPPFCPTNVTLCRSGCACIVYCKDKSKATYCYETKYCLTPRRFTPDEFPTMKPMDAWH